MDRAAPDPTPDLAAASDRLNALAAIKVCTQLARRRVLRAERLDRHRIAADLGAVDALADRLAALLAEPTTPTAEDSPAAQRHQPRTA